MQEIREFPVHTDPLSHCSGGSTILLPHIPNDPLKEKELEKLPPEKEKDCEPADGPLKENELPPGGVGAVGGGVGAMTIGGGGGGEGIVGPPPLEAEPEPVEEVEDTGDPEEDVPLVGVLLPPPPPLEEGLLPPEFVEDPPWDC